MHCFQRRFHICPGCQTRFFLFLEQCFHLSLSDEIGCTFFDVDNFLIIPKCIFLVIDNLLTTWKYADFSAVNNCFNNIAHPYFGDNLWCPWVEEHLPKYQFEAVTKLKKVAQIVVLGGGGLTAQIDFACGGGGGGAIWALAKSFFAGIASLSVTCATALSHSLWYCSAILIMWGRGANVRFISWSSLCWNIVLQVIKPSCKKFPFTFGFLDKNGVVSVISCNIFLILGDLAAEIF